ncbi:MAG: hypothetical protein NC218_00655 [Acetobacter sp.]|nr:hypothetical protein [Acetobacter sp.]
MIFLFCEMTSCYPSAEEYIFERLKEDVATSCLPDSIKAEIAKMPFNTFIKQNPIKKEIAKENAQRIKEQQLGDSIWNELQRIKEPEVEAIRKQYAGKTQILRIKRLWFNSDVLPWTYDAWRYISYSFKSSSIGSYHRGRYTNSTSGTLTPNMSGKAKYIGDNRLDYANIVFSDNSYKRFLIKDNPEWLLANEGEQVELRYVDTGYKVGSDVGRILEKDVFDLVIHIEYTPLFK